MGNLFIKKYWKKILICTSLLLYALSLSIVFLDINFTYRFVAFWTHVISVFLIIPPPFAPVLTSSKFKKAFKSSEILLLFFVLATILVVSAYMIIDYPFVSLHDELRDGGLNAMQIANGTILNIFKYGSYNGHGLIIPTFSSFFYTIFGSSVLTYRIPSLIVACIDVILLYILLRISINKLAAVIGALTLALMPQHIFFTRTELVLAFDSFWTTAILFSFYIWQKRRNFYDYILLGTVLGVAANFHTAVRVVALLIIAIVIFSEIIYLLRHLNYEKLIMSIRKILVLSVFCFVGFGPMLLFTSTEAFFQSNRSVYSKNVHIMNYTTSPNKFITIKDNYIKSVKVWFSEGTTSRYPAHTPIFPPIIFAIFIIGIIYALFVLKEPFYKILILFIFIIPFTNSAITDWVNADHRLAPLLPIGSVFVALGTKFIFDKIRNNLGEMAVVGGVIIFLFYQTYQFFTLFHANLDKDVKVYLTMHTLYMLQSDDSRPLRNVCIVSSPGIIETMNYPHSKEAFDYFVNDVLIETRAEVDIKDNEAYIFTGSCPVDYKQAEKLYIVQCSLKKSLFCPVNYPQDIVIHY